MHKKTPYNRELFDQWDPIAFNRDKLTLDECLAVWNAMWDKYCPAGRLEMPAFDACLLTSLGKSLAMQRGDYKKAIELCDMYLALPDAKAEEVEYRAHHIWRGFAIIESGEVVAGIALLRPWLKDRPGVYEIRNDLHGLFLGRKNDEHLPLLRSFAVELLQALPKCERLGQRAEGAATYRELQDILESAHDKGRIT